MKFWSDSFADGEFIGEEFAFGRWSPETRIQLAGNKNPHLAWSDLPSGTQSLALLCRDPDVPSVGDDVNQEGKTVSASLPRVDFFHWSLIDISPAVSEILVGQWSEGVTARGKQGPQNKDGTRHGLNNYTQWFAGDQEMEGQYFGYDGPCPPWNDEIVHHYYFHLYALDIEKAPLSGDFESSAVLESIGPHILSQASFCGLYAINPEAKNLA